jgi:AcrR family transcriptional regulator
VLLRAEPLGSALFFYKYDYESTFRHIGSSVFSINIRLISRFLRKIMQKRSVETRNRILSTSLELFSKRGFDATGINEICEVADVSKGSFYHHFHSKHDLFVSLLETWLTSIDLQFSSNLQFAESVPSGLRKIAKPLGHVFKDATGNLPMFLEFWLQSTRDPIVWNKTIEPYFRYRHFFQLLMEKGQREGSISDHESRTIAQVFVALSLGLLLSSMLDPDGGDWGKIAESSMNYLLDGIKKENL